MKLMKNENTLEPVQDHSMNHALLEQAIQTVEQAHTQENIWKLVGCLRQEVESKSRMLVPLINQPLEDLMDIPKLNLDLLDRADNALFRRVEMEKGGMAYCAFTSQEELNKGEFSEIDAIEFGKLLQAVLDDDEIMGLIINPWGTSILVDRQLISVIFEEEPVSAAQETSSLYIDRGESADQSADVVVNVARAPFAFNEPCSQAMFERSEGQIENVVCSMTAPQPGEVIPSPAPNLTAGLVFHAALPEQVNEVSLSHFISSMLNMAADLGMHSIAIPAVGFEEGDLKEDLPFPVIVAAGWLNAHPDIHLDVTITCRQRNTYQVFYEYLFE